MKLIFTVLCISVFVFDAYAAELSQESLVKRRGRNHKQDANYRELTPIEIPDETLTVNAVVSDATKDAKMASLTKAAATVRPPVYNYIYRPQKFSGRKQLVKDLNIYNKNQWELVSCVVDDYINTTGYDSGISLRTRQGYPSYCLYRHFAKGKVAYKINNRYSIEDYRTKSEFLAKVSEKNADGYQLVTCIDSDSIPYAASGYMSSFGNIEIYPAYYNATSYCVFKKAL